MKKGYTTILLTLVLVSFPMTTLHAQTTLTREATIQLAPQMIGALRNFSVVLENERQQQIQERMALVQTQLLLSAISNRLALSGGNLTQREVDSISVDLGIVRAQLSNVENRRMQAGIVFDGILKTFGAIVSMVREAA